VSASARAPGDLIGPYRLVSELGAGAMGQVWRARDERLDRYVALKLLPAELAADPERRARMLREARAAAAIRHHSVVTLYDIIEDDVTGDILVMELVEGRTVSDVLRKDGAPPLETALRWIEGMADALVAAHERRILHRDIKAANIMITSDGGVKVLDFGLAKVRDDVAATASSTSMLAQPSTPSERIALDATMPSGSSDPALDATQASQADSYKTLAGSLLGTPLYMAPEQIGGQLADGRSEVFSVGVLAYEILAGKPPYTATSVDTLFKQIVGDPPPALASIPESVESIVRRALAKDPRDRWPTMLAFRDAIRAERKRRFATTKRWPFMIAAAVALVAASTAVVLFGNRPSHGPERPKSAADTYVDRALDEYNVFYNDKALSSLRAALRVTPNHPRANAYMILFGGAPPEDRDASIQAITRARSATPERSKDRALLDAALTYTQRGAAEAKSALLAAGATRDRELAFWAAELDYRSGEFAAARDAYRALLAEPATQFRGRIYDHYSSLLIYFDEPAEALRIGTLYRDTFPGEADAVGTYATTLAITGKLDEAIAAAEDAVRLNEGEDTLAGLAKVYALKGDHTRAKELYVRSLDRAGPSRRPVRRAALAFLQWIDGDTAAATQTVAPCLTGGADANVRERGACLFVAGVIDPARAEPIAVQLDALAAEGRPTLPAYGFPASLAQLVRARAKFFGGGCVVDATPSGDIDPRLYDVPLDFYAAYHVPFFATWSICEQSALAAARGDRAKAIELLEPVTKRAPRRQWLIDTLDRYR
jgi:serine/threonine protein kinase